MRNLRPGPTLSTEVNSLPVPNLGLPRGLEPCTHLAGLLQGSWSRELCLWEVVTFLCCPHSRELEAKSGTASPAWTGKGEPWDPLPTHIPCFPAGGSGIHRQLDKEPAFGAEYRSKVRDPGGHRVGGCSLGLCWGRKHRCLLGVWSSSIKAGGDLFSKRSCQTLSTCERFQPILESLSCPCCGQFLCTAQSRCL